MHKRTRTDSPGLALLARIESHLADWRRRSIWRDRAADVALYDAALDMIRGLQKDVRGQHRVRNELLAYRRADRPSRRLAA